MVDQLNKIKGTKNMKSNTAKIEINDLEVLFEALRDGSDRAKLSGALEQVISLAKDRELTAKDLCENLNEVGINLTDNFIEWINNKFKGSKS